jgi:putative Holliday junction resolvase
MAAASASTLIAIRFPRSVVELEAITVSTTIMRQIVERKQIPAKARVLALDLGKKRIGLALSDPLGFTAQGLPTLERTNLRQDLAALERLAVEREVGLILMGFPLQMSGREGRQAEYTRDFAGRLGERTGIEVRFWDERLTTVAANRVLREGGVGTDRRGRAAHRLVVDKVAAQILLQSYLDSEASA